MKFGVDGFLTSSLRECSSMQQCLWAAYDNKVFVMMSQSGLYRFSAVPVGDIDLQILEPISGMRDSDKQSFTLKFSRIFDQTSREDALDLYSLLGVGSDADGSEIKKAYRRLMLQLHPDHNPDSDQALFNQVARANEILSDQTKRLIYDTSGMSGIRSMEKGELPKGQDVLMEVVVPLNVLFTGGKIAPSFKRRTVCRGCRLNPKSPSCAGCTKCPSEVKMVNQQVGQGFFVQQQVQVESKEFCKFAETVLEVEIPPGTLNGQDFVQSQMGEQRPGIISGNVVLRIKEKEDLRFKRSGNDLHTFISVSIEEALLGFSKQIKHMDDSSIVVNSLKTVQPNHVIRVDDEGMRLGDSIGNLFVTVKVDFPAKLTSQQRDIVNKAFASETQPIGDYCRAA